MKTEIELMNEMICIYNTLRKPIYIGENSRWNGAILYRPVRKDDTIISLYSMLNRNSIWQVNIFASKELKSFIKQHKGSKK